MCRTICKANEGDAELEHLLSEVRLKLELRCLLKFLFWISTL